MNWRQHIVPSMESSVCKSADTGTSTDTPQFPNNVLDDIPDILSDFGTLDELMLGLDGPDPNPFPLPSHSRVVEYRGYTECDPCKQLQTQTQLAFPYPQVQPPGLATSIRDRLSYALKYIMESQPGHELLVQIWAPTTIGDRKVLTTIGQPYTLDPSSSRLMNYRSVSKDFYFSADEGSEQALGLPGRVFVGRMPEWTPDVRLFRDFEYPRVSHARSNNIKGSIALPIFARGDRNCLGVIELVTTTRKINYGAEIESICNALQSVDLRSCEVQTIPWSKLIDTSYQLALQDIRTVLRSVCETYGIPLAQTWIPCMQQGKYGPRHSEENYTRCISTVDSASYVLDETFLPFHQSCSDHHLLKGEGMAGRAFLTNKPCFSHDVSSFSKIEYPLAHHAKLFNLHGAVAVRLRHVNTGQVDFVLEFFLPVDCMDLESHKSMLRSITSTIQQSCTGLRGVTQKEIEEEGNFANYSVGSDSGRTSIIEDPVKDTQKVFTVTAGWDSSGDRTNFSELAFGDDILVKEEVDLGVQFIGEPGFFSNDRGTEKKRTKSEKNVSLEELKKHFAGSLKDAAKNLGVCPTTLKRICRQHGITRWPSRKIKKVSHSLQKLQRVIDSVHGPEGGVQLSSLYDNFTKSVWSEKDLQGSTVTSPEKQKENLDGNITSHNSTSNASSSCSQSSSSSLSYPACSNPQNVTNLEENPAILKQEIFSEENNNYCTQPQTNLVENYPPILNPQSLQVSSEKEKNKHDSPKVKVNYGEEKVIFRLHSNLGFEGLKQEVAKRFRLADLGLFDLKYLDDESEWVLLTCDADLYECMDVYKSSSTHAIKISVCPSSQSQALMSESFHHLGSS
ncbi:Plant regulator RWP-RK family protein [Rhynchospora pubera]|uniref:Plant regulator RWP-RK family protein n=1 Tax=Rhynchospora pubera TaxID=906938 RepID=A0AAV8E9E0_9POAL|nr:Plant regulator RWP-RK family protein [Rhynchospora pubera]